MNTAYIQAAEKINAAALFFACGGYHVNTAFRSCNTTLEVVVYFERCEDRNMIESFMTQYKDENDNIKFDTLIITDKHVYYSITLTKHPS